jgi:hypothetical protein
MKDTITGTMLILAMIAFFAASAALVAGGTRHGGSRFIQFVPEAYSARIGPSSCLIHSLEF